MRTGKKAFRANYHIADNYDDKHNRRFGRHNPLVCPNDKVLTKIGIGFHDHRMWWEGTCCNISY